MTSEEKENIIEILNNNGLIILEIGGEFYATTEFTPSDHNTPYHSIDGKRVTEIINSIGGLGLSDPTATIQKINALPSRKKQYSGDYPYTWSLK